MLKALHPISLTVAAVFFAQVLFAVVPTRCFAQTEAPAEKPAPRFSSVEDYLSKQDATKSKTLKAILTSVQTEFPELEAKIAWNLPMLHRQGKYVLGLSSFTNHLSLNPFSAQVLIDLKPQLKNYVVKKHIFQVPVDWEVDQALLKDLVRARLAELDKAAAK